MTDLDQLLARIDTTLDDCDAHALPPLASEAPKPPPADPNVWPEPVMVERRTRRVDEGQALIEASPKRPSWLVRWLPRRAQP